MDDENRAGVLNTEIYTANRFDTKLGTAWAHELFDLGAKRQVRNPGFIQVLAINSIASSDPDAALELLPQMDPAAIAFRDDNDMQGATFAVRMPQTLFTALVRKYGKKSFPKVLGSAELLGGAGRYPYGGVMSSAIETKDDSIIERTAKQLLDRFQKRLDPPSAVFDFELMLNGTESHWPKGLLKPAIEAAVDGVRQYPVNENNKAVEAIYTTADASTTVHGIVETGLLRIASLAKRLEPELWAKILDDYPNLSTGPMADVQKRGGKILFCPSGCDANAPSPENDKQQALLEVRRLSYEDPDKAARAIGTIIDPAIRAEAFVIAAKETALRNPEKSGEFSAAAEKEVAKVKDPEIQFRSACARLQSDAVNKNRAAMPEDLDAAFHLADKTMRKRRDDGKDTGDLVGPLADAVHAAIKIEPELTIAQVDLIYLPFEKAMMLMAAASALAGPVPEEKKTALPKTKLAVEQQAK
jgi:hypothetical protein